MDARTRQSRPPACCGAADLSGSGKNIAVLELFKGQGGVLAVSRLSLTALEVEEHLLCAACTDASGALDAELTRRLFELPAQMNPLQCSCELPASLQHRPGGATGRHFDRSIRAQCHVF